MVLFGLSLKISYPLFWGFPAGKESACNAGDLGSIPGLGRSPGEEKGYPLQYSGLENSMDCSRKESDTTKWLSLSLSFILNQWFSILGDVAPQGTSGDVWIYFLKIKKKLFVCAEYQLQHTGTFLCHVRSVEAHGLNSSVACGGLCSPARDWNLHCKVASQPWITWVVPGYIFDSHNLEE